MKSRAVGETDPARGFALVDALVSLAVVGILLGVSVPTSMAALERQRVAAAARYLAGAIAEARLAAVGGGEVTGLWFGDAPATLPLLEDGDGDGLTADDRRTGIDRSLRTFDGLSTFKDVRLCVSRGGPGPDGTEALEPGSRAVRLGSEDLLRFAADGQGTSGSVYVCVPGGAQAVVRVFGSTGRTRVLLQQPDGRWVAA